MARNLNLTALAGALVALPLLAASPLLAQGKHTDSTGYPKSPNGTPATSDMGKPVDPKADPAAKPDAPGKASEKTEQKTGTPSTAYPDAPGGSPATSDGGKPVEPKP